MTFFLPFTAMIKDEKVPRVSLSVRVERILGDEFLGKNISSMLKRRFGRTDGLRTDAFTTRGAVIPIPEGTLYADALY